MTCHAEQLNEWVTLFHADCMDVLPTLSKVDAVITDPPYGLSFMGKKWDYDVPSVEVWAECLKVMKPGGHLLAFAGTRTQHRMACRIEDAGFEIRDMIAWVYGSGFPKSLDVSKAIDKAAGAEREVVGRRTDRAATPKQDIRGGRLMDGVNGGIDCPAITAPATESARQWQGWGTALKPALEPISVARKPFPGTVASNVMEHGTGAINIDACRVATGDKLERPLVDTSAWSGNAWGARPQTTKPGDPIAKDSGRWPANLIHDGSDEVLAGFPQTGPGGSGVSRRSGVRAQDGHGKPDGYRMRESEMQLYGDSGSAARFFYCAKTSGAERGEGNDHPTVKPIALMEYLCRLVTPPGGIILDPFGGSGTTALAAARLGRKCILIERDARYCEAIRKRVREADAASPGKLFAPANDTTLFAGWEGTP